MKNLLILSFLLPLLAFQRTRDDDHPSEGGRATTYAPNPDYVSTGEYTHLCLRHDSMFNIAEGKPSLIQANVAFISCGAHGYHFIDKDHRGWGAGSNAGGQLGIGNSGTGSFPPTMIRTDSLGNQLYFDYICDGQTNYGVNNDYWTAAGLATDGSVYVMGILSGGLCGNGTSCSSRAIYPTKVPLPYGIRAVQICLGFYLLIRDQNGDVWSVGGKGNVTDKTVGQGNNPNFFIPVKLSLPAPARLIAGGFLFNYAVLTDNRLFAWGSENMLKYRTLPEGAPSPNTPQDITPNLGFSSPIVQIKINMYATYCITADGELHAWGGNEQGEMGNGYQLDFSKYGGYPLPYGNGYPPATPFYYAYSQGYNETSAGIDKVIQISPINPTPGKHNWKTICTESCGYCMQAYFIDNDGRIFFCGRNKAALCNGVLPWAYVNGPTQSYYPDSWNKYYMTEVNIFAIEKVFYSTSPDCLPSGTRLKPAACDLYKPGEHHAPEASFTAKAVPIGNNYCIVLDNSGSTGGDVIMDRIMRFISGPSVPDMGVQNAPVDSIYTARGAPLAPGTYHFALTLINNYWDSTLADAVVVVPSEGGGGGGGGPIVPPPVDSSGYTKLAGNSYYLFLPYIHPQAHQSDSVQVSATVLTNGTVEGISWVQTGGPSVTIAPLFVWHTGVYAVSSFLLRGVPIGDYSFTATAMINNSPYTTTVSIKIVSDIVVRVER